MRAKLRYEKYVCSANDRGRGEIMKQLAVGACMHSKPIELANFRERERRENSCNKIIHELRVLVARAMRADTRAAIINFAPLIILSRVQPTLSRDGNGWAYSLYRLHRDLIAADWRSADKLMLLIQFLRENASRSFIHAHAVRWT